MRKTIICTDLGQENGQTIFTATGTTIDLGTLGDFSIAIAINSAGHVSGYSPPVPNGPVHAFFYNGTMQDLGTLRSGTASYATSLNDQDLVVGNDALNGDSRPWIWSATSGTVDLTTLITNPAWTLATAHEISATGEIVGAGVVGTDVHGLMFGAGELNTAAGSSKPFVPAFRRRYTADPRLPTPDLLCGVSKQQVARLMQRATQMQQFRRVSILAPLSGSLN